MRYVNWRLTPDREPDAPTVTHAMKCSVCGDHSAPDGDWNPPQSWAMAHSGKNPSHHSYVEIITRPWRTFMEN